MERARALSTAVCEWSVREELPGLSRAPASRVFLAIYRRREIWAAPPSRPPGLLIRVGDRDTMSSAAGLGVVRGPSAGARTARPEARSGRAAAVPRSGSIPSLPQTKPAPASLPSQAAARRQGTLR